MKIHRSIKKKIRFTGKGTDNALRILDRFYCAEKETINASNDRDSQVNDCIKLGVVTLSNKTTCTSGLLLDISPVGKGVIEWYYAEIKAQNKKKNSNK